MSAETIGPYRILRRLGAGGMGDVHLGITESGRPVAVKTVQKQYAADTEFRRRFAQEVNVARLVGGACTAAVVDADTEAELPWLATEFVAGPSLQQAVARHGKMDGAALQVLGAGLVEALGAIHRAGIIHRDLNPSNILLTRDGPRVIDFGISKPANDATLTATGGIIGTPGFMSPEHAAGKELTPASDLFSLGAVLAFAATGEPPFGDGPAAVLLYRSAEEPPHLNGAPEELIDLLVRCLNKEPGRRPQPAELTEAFRQGPAVGTAWLGGAERSVRQRERELRQALDDPNGTRRQLLLLGGTLLATAAAGGTSWGLWQGSAEPGDLPRRTWTATLPRSGMTPLARGAQMVVCADRTGVVSYDRSMGRKLWSTSDAQGALSTSDGSRVWTVGSEGSVQAYDARSGTRLWRAVSAVPDAQAVSQPLPGLLLVTDAAGALHAFDAVKGVARWTTSAFGSSYRTQAVASAGLLVLEFPSASVGDDIHFTALDSATGRQRWTADAQDLYAPPGGSLLYALTSDLRVAALNARAGTTSWSRPSGLPSPEATMTLHAYAGSLSLQQGVLACLPPVSSSGSVGRIALAGFAPADGTRLWNGTRSDTITGQASAAGVLALGGVNEVTGLALRAGRTVWTWRSAHGTATVQSATANLFLVTAPTATGGITLLALDAGSGSSRWHQDFARQQGDPHLLMQDSTLLLGYGSDLTAYRLPNT
ncbi:PQQ-binding-like beta-propeller repeat protein [Kitasatospora sp. NPDC056138]|uniref:serine/threonine-protein kinase n=1 Tax=Kitasatospora sp. NPDC056138 TaxID=3345724 RepID=UPI0035D9C091